MFPHARGLLILFTIVLAPSAGFLGFAQPVQAATPVRYHFGDDPDGKMGWANPAFDDSEWPVAQNDHWPVPGPWASDGFEWVRLRVPVPSYASGPLAIRVADDLIRPQLPGSLPISYEIFVNGQPVAQRGSLQPHIEPARSVPGSVFELPPGLVQPGATAVVSYRVWFQASNSRFGSFRITTIEIGESGKLRLAKHAARLEDVIAMGPILAINALIAILGIVLLVLWRWTGARELLFGGAVLLTYSPLGFVNINDSLGIVAIPWRVDEIAADFLTAAAIFAMVEFMWAIHGYRNRVLKRVAQAATVGFNGLGMYLGVTVAPQADLHWFSLASAVCVQVVLAIVIGANLWPLFTRRKSWMIGLALAITPIAVELLHFGVNEIRRIGPFYVSFLDLGWVAGYLVVFAVLSRGAWHSWRVRDELRVEFETARVIQQQLVAPPGDIPGFRIGSVYQPARQVGGDFFRVTPEGGGGVLIVVGDVSGKGLGAAMTVSAVIGALRSIPPVSPAWILNALNNGLAGQLQGGFVTCSVARIKPDGGVTIANAGHLSPYRSGAEIVVPSGLPLGISAEIEYEEAHFELSPAETLTFLSDGVVEARRRVIWL